jgi:hypothetical protein
MRPYSFIRELELIENPLQAQDYVIIALKFINSFPKLT